MKLKKVDFKKTELVNKVEDCDNLIDIISAILVNYEYLWADRQNS